MIRRSATTGLYRWAASGFDWLVKLRTRHRKIVALGVYAGISASAYALSYLLRFEFTVPPPWMDRLLRTLPLLVAVRLVLYRAFRLARGRWRFVGTEDVIRLVAATTAGSLLFFLLVWTVDAIPLVPRSVILIEWFITTLLTAGTWIGYRLVFEHSRHVRPGPSPDPRRLLIVGAGEAGNLLAREIRRLRTGSRLVGFIDDDPRMWGSTVRGVEVLGGTDRLGEVVRRTEADEVIIAIPSATPGQLRRIVERCEPLDLPFKVLPGVAEVLEGDVRVSHLRELLIDDLLGRDPIHLELPEVEAELRGTCVLITGGAGSIGSEVARQVALYRPARLVLLDRAESDLYFLQRDLEVAHPGLDLVPVVGDTLDARCLAAVFERHRPQRVFHAAAYKHVPLMESNVRQAVRNNVIGTWAVARAVGRSGGTGFTLISTDKAVDPTSVMGATKLVAERVCTALQQVYADTAFMAVRFGNVLGSQGSVIPLFQKQLREGKPLTVTDPDATRYFMTVSEAVQLVLKASVLPEARGHIMMLDMGEPVRILDLARDLIRLAGLRPGIDVEIEFIGLRPGERMHERLATSTESTFPTAFEKVRIVRRRTSPQDAGILREVERLASMLDELSEAEARAGLDTLVSAAGREPRETRPGDLVTRAVD